MTEVIKAHDPDAEPQAGAGAVSWGSFRPRRGGPIGVNVKRLSPACR